MQSKRYSSVDLTSLLLSPASAIRQSNLRPTKNLLQCSHGWFYGDASSPAHLYNDVGNLGGIAFSKAMTTTNIISAFRSTGIYQTDSGVVGEDAFNSNSNRQTIKRSGLHSNGCQPVYLHLIDNRYHLLVIRPQKKLYHYQKQGPEKQATHIKK